MWEVEENSTCLLDWILNFLEDEKNVGNFGGGGDRSVGFRTPSRLGRTGLLAKEIREAFGRSWCSMRKS